MDALNVLRVIGRSVVDMKVLMKPIETIVTHSKEGTIRPEKYRIIEDGETIVVRIVTILTRSEERLDGCRELIFGCQGVINGCLKNFELKYRVAECKWFLYRI
ncbi:conserved hypothetical protein [Candidatus Desulfosporosinus infrequens]|uniref:Uncharacterized protein n=1 Tax=Candidatus Desulfosporosinus infrequens TaxID=2043169 RepID=A0A2U3K1Y1_9FIRM|nr:conserved hypothetical protein [Candidatus Desulfosporosinus infrequens]